MLRTGNRAEVRPWRGALTGHPIAALKSCEILADPVQDFLETCDTERTWRAAPSLACAKRKALAHTRHTKQKGPCLKTESLVQFGDPNDAKLEPIFRFH